MHDRNCRKLGAISIDLAKDPMFALLLSGGLLYFVLGAWHEAILLLIFVLVIFTLTAGQSLRTSHALQALDQLAAPRAMTLRNGERRSLPSSDLRCGDIVILAEGNRVPADGMLLDGPGLMIDESSLTGEFQPVYKRARSQLMPDGSSQEESALFCGCLVLSGTGTMRVESTGASTRLGQIGISMRNIAPERAPLEIQARHFILRFMWLGFALSFLAWALFVYLRGGWLEGMLVGITLAMSLLPQDFPVIVTIFSALEARRIAMRGVLVRKLNVVETLGKITALCADKTGTLTSSTMRVRRLYVDSMRVDVPTSNLAPLQKTPGSVRSLSESLVLASTADSGDAMEDAFRDFASRLFAVSPSAIAGGRRLVKTYPFSADLLAVTQAWRAKADGHVMVACKGAPEAVFRLCRLQATRKAELEREVQAMAEDGLRVLGVAVGSSSDGALPDRPDGFALTFLGLVGLENPLKENAIESIADCHAAGIRVLMVTGDHPSTAKAIARQAGIQADVVMLGDRLDSETDERLLALIQHVSVYARVRPEQKLRLVQLLKQHGDIVAMTGDGVNDAPALRAANVGIAMGARGTDVAREAADIVLTNDDFSDILGAIGQSRRLFDNLTKAVIYIVAAHIPIAGLVIFPLLFGWPEILRPAHVAFVEIVIGPLCSLAFESLAAEPDLMRRSPLPVAKPLVSLTTFLLGVGQGVTLLACALLLFRWGQSHGMAADRGRALAFCGLVLGNLALMLVNSTPLRLGVPPPSTWLAISATLAMLLLALEWPVLQKLFMFGQLGLNEWGLATSGALVVWLLSRSLLRWNTQTRLWDLFPRRSQG